MKKLSIIAVLALATVFASAQYFAGTSPKAFNVIPNNEGTPINITLFTTNLLTASTASNLPVAMSAVEIPAGRDVGLLMIGAMPTNNVEFTLSYQLSPDNVNWTWPPLTIPSGLVTSNATTAFKTPITLSNSVTYPFRYFKMYSVTPGTNAFYLTNAVLFYKSNPQNNNYSR